MNKKFINCELITIIMKDLADIFSTDDRIKILKNILFKNNPFSQIEIVKKTNLSKGLISQYFKLLQKNNILKEVENKYMIKQNNLNVKKIKILLNLETIKINLFKRYNFIISAGIYGSYVKGENNDDSDMDIWVFTKDNINDESKMNFLKNIKKKYNNSNILFLNKDKLENIKSEDEVFYYSLVFSSILLFGEDLENV